jgi:hypothetical protein
MKGIEPTLSDFAQLMQKTFTLHRKRRREFTITSFLVVLILLPIIPIDAGANEKMEPSPRNDFPKLIVTRQNTKDFIKKAKTTHRNLYNIAIQQADDFIEREPPQTRNAANIYREIGESMPSLGLAYILTKDKKYLSGAEKWITALLNVATWEGSGNLGRCAWSTGIAQLYDWLYHDMNAELKKRIVSRLKEEAEIIRKTASRTRALSNHLLIETAAIGTVGLILPVKDQDRETFLDQAHQWTEYIIENAPLDGSWGEGIQYWQYGLGYFLRYLEGARTSGYRDYFNEYHWLKKTGRFPIHFSVPDNLTRVINFGDCGTDRYLPPYLLYTPASKYRDGVVQDYAMKIQSTSPHKFSWMDFLMYDVTVKPVDFKTVEPEFFHFEDHGFVTMRSSWTEDATLVGFRCGPAPGHANQAKPERVANRGYGPGHQHPDINSFVIYANGTWLAIDPGYIRLKETRNHNTLLVNGHGQAGAGKIWLDYMAFQSREPAPKITMAESTPLFDYVIGDAGNIYVDESGLEYFERQLMFIKPNVIIIADRLKGKASSNYEWLLQANEIADIVKSPEGYEIKKEQASLSVIPLLPAGIISDASGRMLAANDVHGSPEHRESEALLRTISFGTTGVEANYVVVLTVNKPGEAKPDVSLDNGMIRVVKNGKEHLINYRPERNMPSKILELVKR